MIVFKSPAISNHLTRQTIFIGDNPILALLSSQTDDNLAKMLSIKTKSPSATIVHKSSVCWDILIMVNYDTEGVCPLKPSNTVYFYCQKVELMIVSLTNNLYLV